MQGSALFLPVVVLAEDARLAERMVQLLADASARKGVDAVWLVGPKAVLDLEERPPSALVVPILDGAGRRRGHGGAEAFCARVVQWVEANQGLSAVSHVGMQLSLYHAECALMLRKFRVPAKRTVVALCPPSSVAEDLAALVTRHMGVAPSPPADAENGTGREHGAFIRSDLHMDVRRVSFASQVRKLTDHNDIEKGAGAYTVQDEIQKHMNYNKHSTRKVTLLRTYIRCFWIRGCFVGTEHCQEGADVTSSCPCEAKDFEKIYHVFRRPDESVEGPVTRIHIRNFVSQCDAFVAYASSVLVCVKCSFSDEEHCLYAYGASCMLPTDASDEVRTLFARAICDDERVLGSRAAKRQRTDE